MEEGVEVAGTGPLLSLGQLALRLLAIGRTLDGAHLRGPVVAHTRMAV